MIRINQLKLPVGHRPGELTKKAARALKIREEEIAGLLPGPRGEKLREIFREVREKQTPEARLVNAMDKLEALIQHNEADLSTWLPLEYDLQLTYGEKETRDIPWMAALRERVNRDSVEKIKKED